MNNGINNCDKIDLGFVHKRNDSPLRTGLQCLYRPTGEKSALSGLLERWRRQTRTLRPVMQNCVLWTSPELGWRLLRQMSALSMRTYPRNGRKISAWVSDEGITYEQPFRNAPIGDGCVFAKRKREMTLLTLRRRPLRPYWKMHWLR